MEQRFPGKDPCDVLTGLVKEAREFIENEAIEEILSRNPGIVGFSSTFQSNCCALALIKEIKKRRPEIITVIGGANCEAEMGEELIVRYPYIDYVGRGECDRTFVDLVRNLTEKIKKPRFPIYIVAGES